MRNHVTHVCAALAIAAFGVGCGGRTNSTQAGTHREETGGTRGVHQRVMLRGCVQPAVQGQGYALRHVMMMPPSEQTQGQDIVDDRLIPQGSWVRLAAGKDMTEDFKSYLNNEVTVTGDVVDSGQNTIGTAGRGGAAQEQSSSRSSVANGDAPRVAVEKVQKIAENCAGE